MPTISKKNFSQFSCLLENKQTNKSKSKTNEALATATITVE